VIRRQAGLAVVGVTVLVALTTGCSPRHTATSTPQSGATAPAAAVSSVAPDTAITAITVPSAPTPADATPATADAVTGPTPAGAAGSVAAASMLAEVNKDLASIDNGTSAADKELAAGDSARSQDDEN